MMKKIAVGVLLMAVGAVMGWSIAGTGHKAALPEVDERAVKTDDSAEKAAAEIDRLRAEVKELKAKLRDSREEAESLLGQAEVKADDTDKKEEVKPRRERFSFAERLEKMKKENPEQYNEMVKRYDDFKQRHRQQVVDKVEFLEALDLSTFTPEAKETHRKLLEQIESIEKMREQLEDFVVGEHSLKERGEYFRELWKMYGDLNELYGQERHNLMISSGKSLGMNSEEADEFALEMQAIIEATQIGGPGFGAGFGRGSNALPPPPR